MIGPAVVGDQDVWPTVAVEVGAGNAQAYARLLAKSRRRRHVLKAYSSCRSLVLRPQIMKQVCGCALENVWAAEIGLLRRLLRASAGRIIFEIVNYYNIKPAIPVVIEESG